MVLRRFSVACMLLLLMPFVSAARDVDPNAKLEGSLEAFRVVRTDEGKEDFRPANEATPNDMIEYRLTYRNKGDDPLQNIHITDPIPLGMEYVELSATRPKDGRVEFSIDGGKNYRQWPITIIERTDDGREIERKATPDMVTHIRWVLGDSFQPAGEITVSYRTLIK